MSDPDGRTTVLNINLFDLTTSSTIYQSYQQSFATPDESFTPGGSGGDDVSEFSSSTTTLIAGHDYDVEISTIMGASLLFTTNAATATGSLFLSFVPVPEPSTGLLVSSGLLALAIGRRKRA